MLLLYSVSACVQIMQSFVFFNDTATTEIYTLSLHDALPISSTATTAVPSESGCPCPPRGGWREADRRGTRRPRRDGWCPRRRSEEHTSELQSRQYLVCRLLLEKKKKNDQGGKRSAVVIFKTL